MVTDLAKLKKLAVKKAKKIAQCTSTSPYLQETQIRGILIHMLSLWGIPPGKSLRKPSFPGNLVHHRGKKNTDIGDSSKK